MALQVKDYEPWEMSGFSELEDYLFSNCNILYTPLDIKERGGGESGERTRYGFYEGLDVEMFLFEEGDLTIVVSGIDPSATTLFSNKLKGIVTGGALFPDGEI